MNFKKLTAIVLSASLLATSCVSATSAKANNEKLATSITTVGKTKTNKKFSKGAKVGITASAVIIAAVVGAVFCFKIKPAIDTKKLIDAAGKGKSKTVESLKLVDVATKGDFKTVESLLKSGIDVNARDSEGCTALICAVREGHTEIVKLLIENGANVNARDNDGYTALITAACWKQAGIIELLLKQQGIAVDAIDNGGYTALMRAVYWNHAEIVELLLKKYPNIDVNVKNSLGKKALDLAKNQEIKDLISNFKSQHP